MAIEFNTNLVHARLAEITAAIDAGAGAGIFIAYDGVRPAKGGPGTNTLVSTTFSDPSFPAPSGEAITANAITPGTVTMAGTWTWWRVTDSDSNFVMDGDVVDLTTNETVLSIGDNFEITSFVLNGGNT